MYILIGLLILVLATFVVAYFAARTWHWGYVLASVGLVLATAGYFILAAETLRINSVLRTTYNRVEAQLAQVNARIDELERGSASSQSISDLEHEVRLQTQNRGPVWRNVAKTGVDPQTGGVRVSVESPVPAGFAANTIVYLFEAGSPAQPDPSAGGQYLGEFRVTQAAGQEAEMLPALELSDGQRQRLANSPGPWVIYEKMPADRFDVFAGLSEDELRQRLPAASVDEYLRQGQPAEPDDEEYRKAYYDDTGKRLTADEAAQGLAAEQPIETRYHRRLRDYALEFRTLAERRAVLLTDIEGTELDNQRLSEAAASATRLTAFRQEQLRKLNHDLEGINDKERPALDRLTGLVQQQADTLGAMLDETLAANGRLARELAAQQAAWTEVIDQATSEAGAAGPLTSGGVE